MNYFYDNMYKKLVFKTNEIVILFFTYRRSKVRSRLMVSLKIKMILFMGDAGLPAP